ncbi:MAG: ImmA/IrrE family metallo-endopeptidase, partial [Cellvibrionaceae bacterium]|nr:ImmA/IrrE family metallo-endopeptidase [Cellvibrionaceae bacterium]
IIAYFDLFFRVALGELGIVLVYERSIPSMKLDGVVFRACSGNPVIGMSLRYSRLDYFWFTLLHELSHINLHIDLLDTPILDDFDLESDDDIEIAANRLAKNSFVDRSVWRNCEPKYNKGFHAIDRFSNQVGIHRSIVAGMLRKEFGNYAAYSKIVNEYDVREMIFNAS